MVLSCEELRRSPSVEGRSTGYGRASYHGSRCLCRVAKNYITYRYIRTLVRQSNTTLTTRDFKPDRVQQLREAEQENSNKNPVVNSTQRDYMAGEVSKDLTERSCYPRISLTHTTKVSSISMTAIIFCAAYA